MKELKDLFKNKKFVIGICLGLVIVSLLIILLFSLTNNRSDNDNTNTSTTKPTTSTTTTATNEVENDNELENENIDNNNSNTTNSTTKKTTTKKAQSNTNNKTTQKQTTTQSTTKKTSESQNNTAKKWTVTFMCDGKLVTTKEVENNKTVSKPSTPTVPSGMEFKYWSLNGNKFDFNTKITKDYVISCSYGRPESENPTEDNSITSAPTNIYFTNENFIKTTNQNRVEVTWDAVKNADSYHIYFSTSENGNYTEKIGVSTTRTRFAMENDGYYKIQATNSDGKKGPMSKAIYVPANFTSNISSSITCNISYNTTTGQKTYNGGNISVSNPGNYNIKVLSTKYNNGQQPVYSIKDDLGTINSKNISYACFEYAPTQGLNYYYTVIAYKKGNNYYIYSNDSVEVKQFISNYTYVTN